MSDEREDQQAKRRVRQASGAGDDDDAQPASKHPQAPSDQASASVSDGCDGARAELDRHTRRAVDHRFVATQRVRWPEKNPQIERKATLRQDSHTVANPDSSPPASADEPSRDDAFAGSSIQPQNALPADASLYDRLEQTDEPGELDEVRAQLEAALWNDGTEPSAAPALIEDTLNRSSGHPSLSSGLARPSELADEEARLPRLVRPARGEDALDAPPNRSNTRRARPPGPDAAPAGQTAPEPSPRCVPDLLATERLATERLATERVGHELRVTPAKAPFDDDETELGASATPAVRSPEPVGPTAAATPSVLAPTKGVLPRSRLVGGGTKAAAVEVRRQQILKDAELPELRSGPLKLFTGRIEPSWLARLDDICAGEFDDPDGSGSVSAKRTLEHLLHDRAFTELEVDDQAAFLRTIAASEGDLTTTKAAGALVRTTVLSRLSRADRSTLHDVFRAATAEDRTRLAHLGGRRLAGRSALEDEAPKRGRLLDHLRTIVAQSDLDARWLANGLRMDAVTSLVLGTLAQPSRLAPETDFDSVVSTIEFALATVRPAEYAGLWRRILSTSNELELAGGAKWPSGRPKPGRRASTPLRELLARVLAPARGGGPEKDNGPHGRVGFAAPILRPEGLGQAVGALFDARYSVVVGGPAIIQALDRLPLDGQRRPPAFLTLLHDRGERLFVFDRVDDRYLYVRGPVGRSLKRTGEIRPAPTREVVDPEVGIDRIDRVAFQGVAGAAVVPAV